MTQSFPLLPLRDIVVFPQMVVPLFVGRDRSVNALERAMAGDKDIFLVAQLDPSEDDPDSDDLYDLGVIASVLQLLKLPDGTVRVLVEGKGRARLGSLQTHEGWTEAHVEALPEPGEDSPELAALMRTTISQFGDYAKLNKRLPAETVTQLEQLERAAQVADTIAANLNVKVADKQAILSEADVAKRLEMVLAFMEGELGALQVEKRIRGRVKRQMEKTQREYYLNEQLKAIQRELGGAGDEEGGEGEIAELQSKIDKAKMPKEARVRALAELKKLKGMAPMSAEATVVRNYLDVMLGVPWGKASKIKSDLAAAQAVLDEDHFGSKRSRNASSNISRCRRAPASSRGRSCASSARRASARPASAARSPKQRGASLSARALAACVTRPKSAATVAPTSARMPGKIVANLKKAETMNPLFLLDEIDKLGQDFRGDPASALLEVLDPEQNSKFNDHYLELDLDLSNVMFVTTANSLNLPQPLLDRMEIIRLEGYTEDEKVGIAIRHLLPKQVEAHGLKAANSCSRRTRCATSSATIPARPVYARSSAKSPSLRANRCAASSKSRPTRSLSPL
jgi:ATP-dependent Lon protease